MTSNWDLHKLLKLSSGYWEIAILHSAVKLDVFTNLNSGITAEELTKKIKADEEGVIMLLNSLCSMGLLLVDGAGYKNTQFSKQYLSKDSETYMGHIIKHHYYLVESWSNLSNAITKGRESDSKDSQEPDGVQPFYDVVSLGLL